MENWNWVNWAVVVGGAILVVILGVYFGTLYYMSGVFVLIFYVLYFVSFIGLCVGATMYYPPEDSHFHHWFIGITIMSFCCHPNWFVCIVHAISNGVFIEGSSRYGLDPVWKQIDLP
jgi:hypothetical protein